MSETANSQSEQLLALAGVDDKAGFIDIDGKWVIEPIYDEVAHFSEGLAYVKNDTFSGFINTKGKAVIDSLPEFLDLPSFYNGLAIANWTTKRPICYNLKGEEVLKGFLSLGDLVNGVMLAARELPDNRIVVGYIKPNGEWLLKIHYPGDAREFSDGVGCIKSEKGLWCAVNEGGDFLYEPTYRLQGQFKNGLAPVYTKGRWSYINKEGKIVIDGKYISATEFSEGYAIVMTEKFDRQIINTRGEIVSETHSPKSTMHKFNEGLAYFYDDNSTGFMNPLQEAVISFPNSYGEIMDDLINGYAVYIKNERLGYLNRKGEIQIEPTFTVCGDFLDPNASNKFRLNYFN